MLGGEIAAIFLGGEIKWTRHQDGEAGPFLAKDIDEDGKSGGVLVGRWVPPKIQHDAGGVQFANGFGQSRLTEAIAAETEVNEIGVEFSFEDGLARPAGIGGATSLSNAGAVVHNRFCDSIRGGRLQ